MHEINLLSLSLLCHTHVTEAKQKKVKINPAKVKMEYNNDIM